MSCYESCNSLDEFLQKARELQKQEGADWVFRGQKENEPLKTSLERACERFGVEGSDRRTVEKRMIREFQRRLHHYTNNAPDDDREDEWMALMQHYGAPTRLLDFAYSPYVAAYFALECADVDKCVTIWAVDTNWCERQLKVRFDKTLVDLKTPVELYEEYKRGRGPECFKSIFMSEPPHKLVLAVNPFRLNERLAYQRGVFLCLGDVTVGFMNNLSDYAQEENPGSSVMKKFTIQTGEGGKTRDEALKCLDQMNINRITLFPGLDGFAQSFAPRTRIHFLDGVKSLSSGSEE